MDITKTLRPFLVKYKPELLIACGISGFVASSVMNIQATKRSVYLIEEEKKRLGRNLTKKKLLSYAGNVIFLHLLQQVYQFLVLLLEMI